jgi:deazaflavin-dependent oxidoreductase (nitroreductase family)
MAQETRQLQIPPRGTRGRRWTEVLFKLLGPLAGGMVSRYRRNAKAEPPQMNGLPLVLLTTTGARTGKERSSLLGGLQDGDAWLVVASKGGSAEHPGWFINLCKNPDKVWLEVGSRKFHVRPEQLAGDEYEKAYARVVAASPQYAGYRKVTDRHISVVRLTPIS